jgi:LysM repeat protein
LNIQKSLWKSFQLQGRRLAIKSAIGVLLVLLAVALMTSISLTNQVHATTVTSYTVVSGDTLSSIANKFGVSVADLAAANGIADPNMIYAGQTIQIPGGTSGHISVSGNTSVNNASGSSNSSYADMIHQVFGPYGDQATNVATCESGLNPNAYNSAQGAAGLFQIVPSTWASTSYASQSVYDPTANTQAAYEIFARDGYSWSEWTCKP